MDEAALAGAIADAAQRVYPHVLATPLLRHAPTTPTGGAAIYLKLESEQVTGSFKARGAVNKLLALNDAELACGVVTASTGNHARGVSHALNALPRCARVGSSAIFVPASIAPSKLAALRALGAPVTVVDAGDCVASERAAREEAARTGATFVSPYNDLAVMAGQGTAGVEMVCQLAVARAGEAARAAAVAAAAGAHAQPPHRRRPLVVIVPVGGGGLIAGVAGALKLGPGLAAACAACHACSSRGSGSSSGSGSGQAPQQCTCAHAPRPAEVVVLGAQPATNACMAESVAAGRLLPEGGYTDGPTLSDGTAGGIEEGSLTWHACARAALSVGGLAQAVEAARRACSEPAAGASPASGAPPPHPATGGPLVDALLTVTEDAIVDGMRLVLHAHRKLVEGAAGTAVALATEHARSGLFAGCDVVALCCGGNVSDKALRLLLLGDTGAAAPAVDLGAL